MLRADSIGWAGTRLCFYMLTSAYVLTCLLAIPCSPTLTHIDNHLTPCDTYLITISGRTSSTSVRHTFRFLVFDSPTGFRFSHWSGVLQCFALTAYMPMCLHVHLRASLHAYMLTRLHAYTLTCMCVHVCTLICLSLIHI